MTSSSNGSIVAPMKAFPEAKLEAVVFLGLLRHNEDQLVERAKMIIKTDRAFFQEIFTFKVDEWTPLHACTLRGARKLVKLALKAGVDPNLEMGSPHGLPGRCTSLHLAAHRGDVSIIQLLVQSGALFNKTDDSNRTPLSYALKQGNILAARKLLRYGANSSELTREEAIFFENDIRKRGSAFLCIPVRIGSHKHRNETATKAAKGQQATKS
jgi:hypothetical protein